MQRQVIINRAGNIALLIVCSVFAMSAQAQQETKVSEGPLLPNLIFSTIDGQEWSLHKNRGSVVVLNFWATWCAPCRTETPMLVKLADEYEKRGLKVAGIALDEN